MPVDKIPAEFGAFHDEGAFFCSDFLIPEETSYQITLGTRQSLKRGNHVERYSASPER